MTDTGRTTTPATSAAAEFAPGSARSDDADRELVRRMAAGEEAALGALYDRWASLVYSLVMHLLADVDEAEEVVEETFWQAWRQATRYEASRGAVSTWLTTIGRSRALDRLRARRRLREEPLSQLGTRQTARVAEAPLAADDPLKGAEASERRAMIIAALDALPPEQREVIELAYFSGLSQSEIAAQTAQPLGTVKTRVRLAMDKLRDRLGLLRDNAS
jgi:RNA polymerase sigma-70 factor (ECF subfamily)